MLIKNKTDIKSSEITPKELYLDRRRFMAASAGVAATLALPDLLIPEEASAGVRLPVAKKSDFASGEKETSFKSVASYNNFYEFSTDKESVKDLAANFKARPWTILVEGEVKKEKTFDIDQLIKMFPLEERTYRLRCVEAWSMVVPWVGFPLGEFIKKCEPTSKAEFVEFRTLLDPTQMPGQARGLIKWPYREGLRLDEAMNPLTILSVGMYGEVLPNQNGAPIRLIVPWKYGFKSIKSIFKIRFVSEMPVSSWMQANPREYGFYANVNPDVDHPRWSQARERRIGEFLKRKTLMFNGYADQVGHLYSDMDLRKYY